MKLRGITPLLAASLAAVVFAGAGCGSKKSSSSTSAAPTSTPTATTPATTGKKKTKKTALRAGQFCSVSKETAYMARGFTCVGGHLKKEGATTGTKTTPSTKTTGTSTKKYKAGQICTTSLASVYAKQKLKCVSGHLVKTK